MDTTRRNFLGISTSIGATLAMSRLIPAWARSASQGNLGLPALTGSKFDLTVSKFPVRIDGRTGEAVGVNGTIPAPLIRFREGDEITINVKNNLMKDTSIHWHGLLVPFQMDGVPGVSFPGIKPGATFTYKFALPQNGTYWYHSHSGLQEQLGHYGPLIIDPEGTDPVSYDREYVLVLSDWTFENPHRVFAKLKKNSEVYNFQKRTFSDFVDAVDDMGPGRAIADRSMWGAMRMSPTDIADVTGATYTYLINGHSTADNWNAVFNVGERVRLRIINASAMTIFNFRIPDLPMSVVASDGLNVQPVETDEFQIGVAETYDVIVEPKVERAFALVAESIDRSGMVVAMLGSQPGMRAHAPALRERPTLTMRDMGMAHQGAMPMNEKSGPAMDHNAMGHDRHDTEGQRHDHKQGVGVDMVAMAPVNRLDEPGLGLEDVPHRTLTYTQLRSLDQNPDKREPQREIELHLTGNMERYMSSLDGIKFSEVVDPIVFNKGERVRMTLVNDTMMSHPIHLHGMFFDLVNGGGDHKPRKHTVIVKPSEKLSYDVTADHIGDWAFHCHLLMHMHAGMMQMVSVRPRMATNEHNMDHKPKDHENMGHDQTDHDVMDHGSMDHGEKHQ